MNNTYKKILIINTVSFGPGGIRKVIMDYYKNLDKDSYKIDIIAIDNNMSDIDKNTFLEGNSRIYVLNRSHVVSYMTVLYKLCRQNKYDVIHVNGNSATMVIELMAAKLGGVRKRIAHCHNTECTHKYIHKILYPVFKNMYTHALACSEEAGNWIFGKSRFEILKNAIDINKYTFSEDIRTSYRKKLSIKEDTFVLGHIGFFNEQKNQEFLIDLLNDCVKNDSYVENILLILIGIGEKQQYIKDKVEQRGLLDKVLFLDIREDIDKLLQIMDLFLFPSKWEGFGLALLEAQLSGLDCIASTNVPIEVNISGNVTYIELEKRDLWREKVVTNFKCIENNRNEKVMLSHNKVRNAGYDICEAAGRLAQIYDE